MRSIVIAAAAVVSIFGFSRPPSTEPGIPRPFEITVREVRTETIYRAAADSMVTGRFESSLSYFGRIEESGSGGTEKRVVTVHTDSLAIGSDVPLRFTARIHRDTVEVTTGKEGRVARTGALEIDEAMFACLFDGPALRIVFPAEGGPASAGIEDLKSECAGGLYRRLNLAVTLGAFVFGTPIHKDDSGGGWQTTEIRPSFSGLGHFPQLRWSYKILGIREGSNTPGVSLEIACDTTLTHVRTIMPNGETADIIADRIRVRGFVRQWRDVPSFYQGEIKIEEDIRYVRPRLGTSVLNKQCSAEIVLERR